MKRTSIALALLLSAQASAELSFEEAKKQLETAQANYDAALKRVQEIKTQTAADQKQAEQIAGKPELNTEMEEYKTKVRKQIEEHNAAVDACKTKLADLQKKVADIGNEHKIVSKGESFTVEKTEPVTVKEVETPRQPYATRGSTYPRAL